MEYLLLVMSGVVSTLVNALHPRGCGVVRHVVAFKLDHLGDLVTAAPAISAVRLRHPAGALSWQNLYSRSPSLRSTTARDSTGRVPMGTNLRSAD